MSLSGAFGEVRLGRDYTPTFWNDTVFDPFGTNGVGTNLISTANGCNSPAACRNSGFTANTNYIRASNSIGYFLPPNLGGFYGQFMYAFNEKTSYDPGSLTPPGAAAIVANPALRHADNARAGRYVGGRVGYANGPLDVALAYGESTIGSNFFLARRQSRHLEPRRFVRLRCRQAVRRVLEQQAEARLVDDFNASQPVRLHASPGANGWLLGATVPVGAGLIRVSYSAVKYKTPAPHQPGASARRRTRRPTSSRSATCTTCRSARPCTRPWRA